MEKANDIRREEVNRRVTFAGELKNNILLDMFGPLKETKSSSLGVCI